MPGDEGLVSSALYLARTGSGVALWFTGSGISLCFSTQTIGTAAGEGNASGRFAFRR